MGQLAFTPSRTGVIKLWPLSSTVVIPNTRPPSAYPRHYSGLWLLGASCPLRHPAWLPARSEPRAVNGLLRSLVRWVVTLGCCFTPVSMWDGYDVRIDYIALDTYPFWTGPTNQRWPALLDDASTTASLIVSHSHWLDRITMSGSPYAAVSARFCRLITSRATGDDAVTRTTAGVGLDETYQMSLIAPTSVYNC